MLLLLIHEPLHLLLVKITDIMISAQKILQLTKTLGPFLVITIPCHWEYKDVEVVSFLKNMFRYYYKLVRTELFMSPPMWGCRFMGQLYSITE